MCERWTNKQYSKPPTYDQVPFQKHICKSNQVSLGTPLTQSAK